MWVRRSPSPISGGPPLIVSQPTTPLESPLVNRRMTPRERRDDPRRVADRSVAMRRGRGSSGLGWLWLVLAIAGGVGGATYYYSRRGFAPFSEAVGDSMAVPGLPIHPDSAPAAAPPLAGPDSVAAQPPAAAADSAPSARPVRPPPTSRSQRRRPPPPGDSGSVRLVGLPRGSTVHDR